MPIWAKPAWSVVPQLKHQAVPFLGSAVFMKAIWVLDKSVSGLAFDYSLKGLIIVLVDTCIGVVAVSEEHRERLAFVCAFDHRMGPAVSIHVRQIEIDIHGVEACDIVMVEPPWFGRKALAG